MALPNSASFSARSSSAGALPALPHVYVAARISPQFNVAIDRGVYVDDRAAGHPGDLLDRTFYIELRSPNPSKTNSKQQLLPQIAFRRLPQLNTLGTNPEYDNRHHHVERYLRYRGGN